MTNHHFLGMITVLIHIGINVKGRIMYQGGLIIHEKRDTLTGATARIATR